MNGKKKIRFLVDFVIEFGKKPNSVVRLRQEMYPVHLAQCSTYMEL